MGRPMAQNLLARGFSVVVHSRSRGPVDELVAAGAQAAKTPADVARQSAIVVTMVPDSPDVEAVLEGADGSGRSTQITLLREWLESEGFAVATVGLRRSNLVARDIDELLATNAATRLTLTLMYATDLFDRRHEDLAVAHLARLGGLDDGLDAALVF